MMPSQLSTPAENCTFVAVENCTLSSWVAAVGSLDSGGVINEWAPYHRRPWAVVHGHIVQLPIVLSTFHRKDDNMNECAIFRPPYLCNLQAPATPSHGMVIGLRLRRHRRGATIPLVHRIPSCMDVESVEADASPGNGQETFRDDSHRAGRVAT
jgi:hypothetical protein